MRIAERASVGHVEAPDPHPVDRGSDRARLQRKVGAFFALQEAGHAVEADLHVVHRVAAGDRDTVPLVEPVQLHLVAGLAELVQGELCLGALDLLHGQHVDLFAAEPVDDAADAAPDGIDVPGGDAHDIQTTASPWQGRVPGPVTGRSSPEREPVAAAEVSVT